MDVRKDRSRADPFVIATAKVIGATVVTDEKHGAEKDPRIPFVCERLGVPCLTPSAFVEAERLRAELDRRVCRSTIWGASGNQARPRHDEQIVSRGRCPRAIGSELGDDRIPHGPALLGDVPSIAVSAAGETLTWETTASPSR